MRSSACPDCRYHITRCLCATDAVLSPATRKTLAMLHTALARHTHKTEHARARATYLTRVELTTDWSLLTGRA